MITHKETLRKLGIEKAAGGSISLTTTNFSGILVRDEVLPLIQLTRSHSEWLGGLTSQTRSGRAGTVPIYRLQEPVMEPVGELDPKQVTTTPPSTNVAYRTQKFKAQVVLSREDIEEASRDITSNFEQEVMNMITTGIHNDTAEVVVNGNTALSSTAATRLERLRSGRDGIIIKLAAGANVYSRDGAAFGENNFDALYDRIPDEWRVDKSKWKWMYADRMDNAYRRALKSRGTDLGDQAFGTKKGMAPMGVSPLVIPQLLTTEGPTAIAPTSAAGTTNITFVLSTLVTAGNPATIAAGIGRKFLVTHTGTGVSEVAIGFQDTTLQITTVGILGQVTVSTTAGDYTVRPYDQSRIILGDPKGIQIVWKDEWVFDRERVADLDGIKITIHLEFDILVPVPEMFMMLSDIALPPLSF